MLTGQGSLIALRVAGDSMVGAAIADGDLVVVRQQPDADSGDIGAAMFPSNASADWEATVKTLKKTGGHLWLLPHNPAYSPAAPVWPAQAGKEMASADPRLGLQVTCALTATGSPTSRPTSSRWAHPPDEPS
jgi:repressor LexA